MRIHEIYRSVQGESRWAGMPCTFVRTTGCDLRCVWCDTEQAFYGGSDWTIDEILAEVDRLGNDLVELTGGEPLLQRDIGTLASALLEKGAKVLCETGGHRDISVLPSAVIKIMDVKCPESGESDKNRFENFLHLGADDEIKFVVQSRADFEWAREVIQQHRLAERVGALLISPVFGEVEPSDLVAWIIESGLPLRLNLQLHKYIWSPSATGV
ncbi:MAG: radical SAM protein [Planctomycetes bacterium]|nr:radical SAM protein [Planctomycetota bacterium]